MDLESSNQSVWSGEGCLPEENRKRIKKLIVELMYMSVWRDVLQFCQSQEWISSRHTENYQFSSVAQSCPTICDPMGCSTPGFPAHHQLPELAQTHVHWVGDAIQSFHPLSPPSLPAFNLSQHQGLFQWDGSSHQVAKILELQLQHQSFQWIFRTDFLIKYFFLLRGKATPTTQTSFFLFFASEVKGGSRGWDG